MINKIVKIISLMSGTVGLFGCAATYSYTSSAPVTVPAKLTLEIQEYQSKSFEIDKKTGFSSTISVFQDLGFIINSANYEIGFITADNIDMQIATASFEEYEKSIKIRLNFKIKPKNINSIFSSSLNNNFNDERDFYNRFFDKVDETIFIKVSNRKNNNISSVENNLNDKLTIIENKISDEKVTLTSGNLINNNSTPILNFKVPPITTKITTIPTSSNANYTATLASDFYKTVNGDTLDRIIQKTMKDSPLRIELLREAFVLQNPLKLNLNSREKVKVGIEIKIPKNDYIIPAVIAKNDFLDIKTKEIEDSYERGLINWKEESRKWIRFP